MKKIIGKVVKVVIDRPIGSRHPNFRNIVYEVNYGYVDGVLGGDRELQDAYVLGINIPLVEFIGEVVAIIVRKNDVETKWIVVPNGSKIADEEIISKIHFQEKYFDIKIMRN